MNGKGGYLFKSNSIEEFQKSLEAFLNDDKESINKKRILTKKISKQFTRFNHYQNLLKSIN